MRCVPVVAVGRPSAACPWRGGSVCAEDGAYILRAVAVCENAVAVIWSHDDGGGADGLGTVVEAVMRLANQSRSQSSEALDLDTVCY